jgi:lipoate-protein ligase A
LIVDGGADAAQNMAIDEAILDTYERGEAGVPPTLRLYGWTTPTYSLGRTQRGIDPGEVERLVASGLEVVRRPTGGDAVLHDHERTYAVVGALGSQEFPGGVVATYARIARALVASLTALGLRGVASAAAPGPARGATRSAVCFERLSGCEVTFGGRKLVGSAQARRRGAFLQQGSIPIRLDALRLAEAAGRPVDAGVFTDLATAAGREPAAAEVDAALVSGFTEVFGVSLVAASLSAVEALRAAELRAWRYDSLAWTVNGRFGERERRWSAALA